MRRSFCAAVLLFPALIGCGQGGRVKEEAIEVKQDSGLARAKALLEKYANGQPLGSEAASFPNLVEEVRKTDPDRATVLEKGFADLQQAKSPAAVKSKAKDLLKQMEPRPNPNG